MTEARNITAPTTPPATAAIDTPLFEVAEDVVLGPDVLLDTDGEIVEEVEAAGVEEGERLLRQPLSSEAPTILISELPPLAPTASTIKNIIDVPWTTSAFQSNDPDANGRLRTTEVPPGTIPMNVTG